MKQIETKIQKAMEKLAPDVLPQVLASEASRLDEADWEIKIPRQKTYQYLYRTLSMLAACFVLAFGIHFYSQNLAVDSTIDLDVNPSIELTTNKKDIIIDMKALNEEGRQILEGMSLKKVEVNTAMNAIIGSMVKLGYLEGTNNSILVSVQNKDTGHAQRLQEDITGDIKEALNVNHVSGAVYHQYIDGSYAETVEGIAQQYGISRGKAAFIQKLVEKDPTLTVEKLADLSLKEIALIVKERNIDISDMTGYEWDDSISENVEEIIEENDENTFSTQEKVSGNQSQSDKTTGDKGNYSDRDDNDDRDNDDDRDDNGDRDDNDRDDNDDRDDDDEMHDDDDRDDNDDRDDDDEMHDDDDRDNDDWDDDGD